jgi:dTDP-glucose 4,6-dehydratase
VIVTNCSNNYGPWQFPEKFIPLMITNAINTQALPVYGDGLQRRDWLHVADHREALTLIAKEGKPGSTYTIGGGCEMANREVLEPICKAVDAK